MTRPQPEVDLAVFVRDAVTSHLSAFQQIHAALANGVSVDAGARLAVAERSAALAAAYAQMSNALAMHLHDWEADVA